MPQQLCFPTSGSAVIGGRNTGPICGLHQTAPEQKDSCHGEKKYQGESGVMQPLICIVNIAFAEIFPIKPLRGRESRAAHWTLPGDRSGRGREGPSQDTEKSQNWMRNRWRGSGQGWGLRRSQTGFWVDLVTGKVCLWCTESAEWSLTLKA